MCIFISIIILRILIHIDACYNILILAPLPQPTAIDRRATYYTTYGAISNNRRRNNSSSSRHSSSSRSKSNSR